MNSMGMVRIVSINYIKSAFAGKSSIFVSKVPGDIFVK